MRVCVSSTDLVERVVLIHVGRVVLGLVLVLLMVVALFFSILAFLPLLALALASHCCSLLVVDIPVCLFLAAAFVVIASVLIRGLLSFACERRRGAAGKAAGVVSFAVLPSGGGDGGMRV